MNTPVKLNITSMDVIHSLYIPAFRVKVDAVKGLKTYAWFCRKPWVSIFFNAPNFAVWGMRT